ncbi:MAG: lytic murein transglycosylase [Polaromonas sp.]|uniref:lytic murein transglycosylase n=1 Tax=Polaromonas sp. TaxID=1869339 RepID=UPI00273734C3|nr:lytic murein transglycosylase [Polaromonas sp.]MDP1953602.1 lytic murein transglycosylase [Polaromonas sp.]MDP3755831.1 lytic murein transglycosylase [Polaromonas sp.]
MQQTRSRFPVPAISWLAPTLLTLFALAAGVATLSVNAQTPQASGSPAPSTSGDTERDQRFARWVADFSATARAAGISDATLQSAFKDVRFIPRVTEADSAQPEFTRAVWDYLDRAVSAQRIARGQDRLLEARPAVDGAAARYGVPAEILAAIWGMESNYGSNTGDIPTIDALASLGFEGRREAWARSQLLAALKILQNRDIDRAQMIGSWAGAMGQTQFLPSNFLAYAVDADGDGRRDIWGSLPDVMASTANFLARSGWQAGQPWGLEVRLPPGFDLALADGEQRRPASAWAVLGVQSMNGSPLPALPDSAILLPAGVRGPAFLVGPNFRTILRYNNSTSYALAVSLLAQALAGGPAVQTAWPRDLQPLSRSQLLALQTALNARGFDSGTPDGVAGPATRGAIRRYQQSGGLPADGYPTLELLQGLQ